MTTAPKKFNIDFEGCEENEVLGYAVYRDTLVYLFKMGNTLRGGIYRTFNSAINEWSGPLYIQEDINTLQRATVEDFARYRVCTKYLDI